MRYSASIATPCPLPELDRALRHPEGFAEYSSDIVSVVVDGDLTHWTMLFRGAPLRWTQRDTVPALGGRRDFEQVEGDFTRFGGSWAVEPASGDAPSQVTFTYDFRTDIAHLAGAVDPMIARVLLRSSCDVIAGVSGAWVEVLDGVHHLQDLPDPELPP